MKPTPPNGSRGAAVARWSIQEFASWSDANLLRLAVSAEQSTGDFDMGTAEMADGGHHFMQSAVPPLLTDEAPQGLQDLLGFFGDLAEESWEATRDLCASAPIARSLRQPISAFCLALIAWRQWQTKQERVVKDSLDHRLQNFSIEDRQRALAYFAHDAAISCAYEGIDIAPRHLAKAIGA